MNIAVALCQVAVIAVLVGLIVYDFRPSRPTAPRGGDTWDWDNPGWNLLPSDGELAASEERLDRSLRTIAHEENPAERSNAQTGPVQQHQV